MSQLGRYGFGASSNYSRESGHASYDAPGVSSPPAQSDDMLVSSSAEFPFFEDNPQAYTHVGSPSAGGVSVPSSAPGWSEINTMLNYVKKLI